MSIYSGQSKRTKYREIAKEANIIRHQLDTGKTDSFHEDLGQETCANSQDFNTFNAATSASFFNINSSSGNGSNSSDDSNFEEVAPNLIQELHLWSQKHNISHSAVTDLLHILKPSHPSLPLDARTLLHTPRTVDVVSCGEGSFVYFGLERNLVKRASTGLSASNYPFIEKNLASVTFPCNNFLSVSVNVDGLPIQTSSTKSFWPLLCIVDQSINKKPIVVALYYGDSKPADANNFLRPFVEECKNLEKNGVVLNDVNYVFRVSCVIADSPARSFIKCIVGHNSLHGCEKCTQEGIYFGRTTWQYNQNPIVRTDASFKSLVYEDHQRSKSLLSELEIGLVTQVPLDYMHLVCLGVVKRLVRLWVERGPKKCKLNAQSIESISSRLSIIIQHYPKEFSRRPRPIHMFKFWKATEYRSFILYLGPVVLYNLLPHELYTHFMLLHCAIYIFVSDFWKVEAMKNYANDLLHCFVKNIPRCYSKELLVYNFHNLLHLVSDVENFGCLDSFSAFPFENFMGSTIKRMVHAPNNPLQQVAKRLEEKNFCEEIPSVSKNAVTKKNGKIVSIRLPQNNCIISLTIADSCFLTENDDIVIVKSIEDIGTSTCFKLCCDFFLSKDNFYTLPLESSRLGIYRLNSLQSGKVILSTDIRKKCLLLPDFTSKSKESFICFPYCNMDICH